MISYTHGASSVPLIGETLGELVDRVAREHPDRDAVVSVHEGVRLTYGQFAAACDELARGLMAIGVRHGDRVGIWSTNNAPWVITQFATAKIGAILVNVNPAYRTVELEYALRQSGVSVLLSQAEYKTSAYLDMIEAVRDKLESLRTVIAIGGDARRAGDLRWDELRELARTISAEELTKRQDVTQFDEAINIQYTSGTTGFPKGATLSHHNILNNGYFIGEACRYTPSDRVCIPVPFYHCFGMVLGNLACVTHGAAIVIPAPTFDPQATLAAVELERCTSLYGVPTMFIAELALPDFAKYDLSSLRTGIMAGAPCPAEVMKRVRSEMHMDEVTICYGMTETSPVSFQTAVDDPVEKRVGTVGRVHPHVEVKIVDEHGRIVPRTVPGELCTRGYCVMLGYWDDPENTAASIDAARYMHTGDVAIMDEDGYVMISGRVKDMVIRGGENIYPREIEEFLYTHPAIRDVSVVGVPDEHYGEQLCAWIILHEDAQLAEEDVRVYCRGKIAHFKVPHYVRFTDAFPMTVTGKVQKYKLREAFSKEPAVTR
ncbi:MAG TPA: AMP-binding protein [Candidatus Acidoferrales bacterium]|nr:AMP-binding protein [Candidatus Acidoferrales bacterium]